MDQIITAIFDGETLHPETPLDLPTNQRYQIIITPIIEVSNDDEFDQPGLHLGAISMREDFDEPLPDEFS
jgi:hypothetical protein